MKKVSVWEFKDLSKKNQAVTRDVFTNDRIEIELQFLWDDYEQDRITEDTYYSRLGCTKSYAESTSWFVPSCYYEKNKEDIDAMVEDELKDALFDKHGNDFGTIHNFEA